MDDRLRELERAAALDPENPVIRERLSAYKLATDQATKRERFVAYLYSLANDAYWGVEMRKEAACQLVVDYGEPFNKVIRAFGFDYNKFRNIVWNKRRSPYWERLHCINDPKHPWNKT